jgi:hypothetical protein
MSTVQQPPEPEQPEALPPGFDPTRDVLRPPRAAVARPPYQPLAGRAAAATAVLGLLLAVDMAAVISGYFEVQLFDRLIVGENVPDAQLEANDTRVGMIGLGQGALWVACAIAFISWMHRAYENIQALPPAYPRYATGWTIGAWFVPILNFFRPKQMINDIWSSGTPAGDPPAWLMVWWIGFLISGFLGRIATPNLAEDATLEEVQTDSINYMVSDGFDALVLVLAILVVRVCTRRQEARAQERAGEPDKAATLPWAQPAQPAAPVEQERPAGQGPPA